MSPPRPAETAISDSQACDSRVANARHQRHGRCKGDCRCADQRLVPPDDPEVPPPDMPPEEPAPPMPLDEPPEVPPDMPPPDMPPEEPPAPPLLPDMLLDEPPEELLLASLPGMRRCDFDDLPCVPLLPVEPLVAESPLLIELDPPELPEAPPDEDCA